ncbi:N-acetylglucosamine kinase [Sphingobacteriaceae bacterium WQ 2009]|uniref:N-acetylglucosamine kinase n=1 Tax=Rhinopithecimicrobium faecis TaxID=2820698 RepID=A0A8T4HBY3_9SPHI|nr:N-acetylglucosamine kinase [Sphingobacteriaceae bacterium WQ 2009]
MILVVDSGSSKSDWKLDLPDSSPISFSTKGLNPFFVNAKEIVRVIKEVPEILPYSNEITELYFFGAGCITPDRREIVSNALTPLFENAFISVEDDLLGSAYATCQNNKGFISTLGTGSDISFFNGEYMLPSRQGNGYVLGDEGSGTWYGKKLITQFLYGRMPKDLSDAFQETYRLTKEIVIKNVYERERPNAYLASFVPFMSQHIRHPYIDEIIREGFDEFVKTNIMSYPDFWEYECHFVGSIAYIFDLQLRDICNVNGVRVGKILKSPIDSLFDFVLEREKQIV